MGKVTFTATFSGGDGTLSIQIDGADGPNFTDDGHQDVTLDKGTYQYQVSGAASSGDGGNVRLDISGDVQADTPQNYGPGLFDPEIHPFVITK